MASNKFKDLYGHKVSNTQNVNNLYSNVLGRLVGQSGVNYWLGQLNNGIEERYEVLLGFAESTENKTIFSDMTGII